MCWFVVLKGYDFSGNSGRNFWTWNFVANVCLSQFKSVKNSPVSRLHDCHTRTFCTLYCAPCYDYGFNNKRCWHKNFAKISLYKEIDFGLCSPNSRSHQESSRNCHGGFGECRETFTYTTLFYVFWVMISLWTFGHSVIVHYKKITSRSTNC